jgi:hypothetical protein
VALTHARVQQPRCPDHPDSWRRAGERLFKSLPSMSERDAAMRIFQPVHLCVPASLPSPRKIMPLRSRCTAVSEGNISANRPRRAQRHHRGTS